ncbi:MAG TPA: hypothetical protein VIL31_11495 [Cyclobacteriaceae bacterium]|jgi:hypothetical protein
MKGGKVVVLIAALAAPVAVFLFLKFFGRNEFAVEPLYTDSVPATNCNVAYTLPYRIPDSVRHALPFNESTTLVVVSFPDSTGTAARNLRRLEDTFAKDPVTFVSLPIVRNERLRECVYFLDGDYSAVLVDQNGTIRGRYALSDLKEADRLSVELKIILHKYR